MATPDARPGEAEPPTTVLVVDRATGRTVYQSPLDYVEVKVGTDDTDWWIAILMLGGVTTFRPTDSDIRDDDLKSEVRRLRAALVEIQQVSDLEEMGCIAREALGVGQ